MRGACWSLARSAAAREPPVVGGVNAPALCGGEDRCAAEMSAVGSASEGCEEEEEAVGGSAPLFMGARRVRLAFLPRTFPVTAARINRARSARLR